MVWGRDKRRGTDRIETVVGSTARFSGRLETEGGIRIDGQCEGSIEAGGNVIVGDQGRVLADVKADNVSVSGAVKGNIIAAGRLEILATGKVWGDISVEAFLIEEGGFFRGKSLMAPGEEPPLLQAPEVKESLSSPEKPHEDDEEDDEDGDDDTLEGDYVDIEKS